ncbi:MAG: histidine--tRNA ligase [Planctomycetes bacterium]|nr:histidine--tRNA ligase [Planctomycetota bacterium]
MAAFQSPKGTRDFYPADMAVRRHVENIWRKASVDCGYDEIEGPTFEHLALYTAKSGPGIVSELFSFRRAGGEDDYALRPEFTPTLARMAAARAGSLTVPTKWFAIPLHFRAERPQRGRLREFVQWNVDLLGSEGAAADSDVIACAALALERLGLKPSDVQFRMAHRGASAAVLTAAGVAADRIGEAFELLDRREKLTPEEFQSRAVKLGLDEAAQKKFAALGSKKFPMTKCLTEIAAELGVAADLLAPLIELALKLNAMGLAEWCQWDFGIVRGLAYYTGTVFEVHEAAGKERAIAGGGRYDGLVEMFGGPKMPAMGFGMGDVVLGLVLADKGLLPKDGHELMPRPDVFLISDGSEASEIEMPRLAMRLRREGLHVRYSWKATKNIGKLLSEAGKCRAKRAVILGSELAEGAVAIKDLDGGGQRVVPLKEVAAALCAPCGNASAATSGKNG